jgi:DNA-binding beta-propeller fold protein YncE
MVSGMRMWMWALLVSTAACAGKTAPEPTLLAPSSAPAAAPVLLVASKAEANVTFFDVATKEALATLPTGTGPHEIAVSPDGRLAVIADYGDQAVKGSTLTVIDVPARRVVRTVDLGEYRRPHGALFLPGGAEVVVTVEENEAVIVVDVIEGAVRRAIPTRERVTHMVALSPDGRRAYTTNIASGTVSLIDLAAGTLVRTASVAPRVEGLALLPGRDELWVGSNEANTVLVLDAVTLDTRATLAAAGVPIRVTATPDGRRVLVTNAEGGKLQLFDAARRELTATVELPFDRAAAPPEVQGPVPIGTVVSPDSRTAYVSLMAVDRVAIVDRDAAAVTGTIETGKAPDGIGLAVLR